MQEGMQLAGWGLVFTALMYVIGNGVWVNHLVRRRLWLGWALWIGAAAFVLFAGAAIEARLVGDQAGIWQRLTQVDGENHWIAVSLFALLSVPGAASVIFKQDARWTRLALLIPALVVFIPAGMSLGAGREGGIITGLGTAIGVGAIVLAWQFLLDKEAST